MLTVQLESDPLMHQLVYLDSFGISTAVPVLSIFLNLCKIVRWTFLLNSLLILFVPAFLFYLLVLSFVGLMRENQSVHVHSFRFVVI